MADSGIITIAKKEFFDHLRSRKFLLILGILLIVACVGILNGVSDYHAKVKEYDSLQQTVPPSSEYYSLLLDYMKLQPSALLIFYQMSTLFAVIGGILGIAMGFDLVTKEKESKSLKLLLAHPAYRDEVINGKALGGIAAIGLALGIITAASLAILLIVGIVPDISEFAIILLFSAVTFLYIFTCFAIALLMSTLCEESGQSLIFSLIIFMVLGSLVPAIVSSPLVMDKIIGQRPEMPSILIDQMMTWVNPANWKQDAAEIKSQNREAWDSYIQNTRDYGDQQMRLRDIQYLFSPTKNYEKITICLTNPVWIRYMLYMSSDEGVVQKIDDQGREISVDVSYTPKVDFDFAAILSLIIGNIIALLILPSLFFGLAYVRFMRMDIR